MPKVFISGSIQIKHLDTNVLNRINNILEKHYNILVGDANGVDSSVQGYLKEKEARSVIVYCIRKQPRNNIGNWKIKSVSTTKKPGTRAYYTAKDLEMAVDCDYGLMIWDSKSTGTLSNTIELLRRGKKSLVYVNEVKKFLTISSVNDLRKLLQYMSPSSFNKAEDKLRIKERIELFSNEQIQLFA